MPYSPSKRRRNLVTASCLRYVRDMHPGIYAEFVRQARMVVPVRAAGRPARPEPEPTMIVPVPVREGYRDRYRPLNTLRPMKKGNDRNDRQL